MFGSLICFGLRASSLLSKQNWCSGEQPLYLFVLSLLQQRQPRSWGAGNTDIVPTIDSHNPFICVRWCLLSVWPQWDIDNDNDSYVEPFSCLFICGIMAKEHIQLSFNLLTLISRYHDDDICLFYSDTIPESITLKHSADIYVSGDLVTIRSSPISMQDLLLRNASLGADCRFIGRMASDLPVSGSKSSNWIKLINSSGTKEWLSALRKTRDAAEA